MSELESPASPESPVLDENDLLLFGRRLRQRRHSKGWSQKQLAAEIDLDPGRLSRLERGKAVPQLHELIRLRQVLGGTLDELIFETKPQDGPPLAGIIRELELEASEEQIQALSRLLHNLLLSLRIFSLTSREASS